MEFRVAVALLLFFQAVASIKNSGYVRTPNSILRREAEQRRNHKFSKRDDVDPELLYPAYNLSVPIDHFPDDDSYAPHTNGTFNLRYWFDATYYKDGGPVIVLESGETDGSGRLPFLQKGIVAQLAQATNGLGVILEHRYYGTSFPTPDLSTENLRFLTTEQAMADVAYFAQNVQFKGVNKTLTAPDTPYILYGGSYAGAFVAFMRVQYPDLFWGSISSSGVTQAIWDYWQYYEPIRQFAPPDCVRNTQLVTNVVDNILMYKGNDTIQKLKNTFGLGGITNNKDFANSLTGGITGWQGRNWDPEQNDPTFFEYCNNMTATAVLSNTTLALSPAVKDLLAAGGYANNTALQTTMLNYIGYINITRASECPDVSKQDSCFTTLNATQYQLDDYSQQTWRSWDYQVCTEWGYIQTGSGVPQDILPLVSRTLDIDYDTFFCHAAFNITAPADLDRVNKYGGFNISYDRLAIIGGQADPWRPATPLADEAPKRVSTTNEPVLEIPDAVHHWDENGLFPNETTPTLPPNAVVYSQQFEKDFVVAWMEEYNSQKKRKMARNEL